MAAHALITRRGRRRTSRRLACTAWLAAGAVVLPASPALAGGVKVKLVAVAPSGSAYYVDRESIGGRCSDSRTALQNSVKTPWCSLARAFAAAPSGSRVYIRAGQYPNTTIHSFAPASTVTFEPFPGERPVVNGLTVGSSGSPSRNLALLDLKFTNPGLDFTDLSNLQLNGNEFAMIPEGATGCTGGSPSTAHCTSNTPAAVLLAPPMSGVSIDGNDFHDGSLGVAMHNGTPPSSPDHPLATTFQNISIDGNTFSRMGDVVIQAENYENVNVSFNTFADDQERNDIDPECHCDAVHAIGGGDRLVMDGNLVYGGRGFLIQPTSSTGRSLSMTHVAVENNVFTGRDFGVRVYSAPGIEVLNNTVEGPAGQDLGLSLEQSTPATSGAVVANNFLSYFQAARDVSFAKEDYNDVGQRGTGIYAPPAGPHDITRSPSFLSPGAPSWDYGLQPRSAGVGSGSAADAPSVDRSGWQTRSPVNLGADGAEEPSSTASTTAVGAPAFADSVLASHNRVDSTLQRRARPRAHTWRAGAARLSYSGRTPTIWTGLAVTCATWRSCRLRVSVRALESRRHHRRRRVTLAATSRRLPARQSRVVVLSLSRRTLRRLRRRHVRTLRVRIQLVGRRAARSEIIRLG
jgi:hypothetical protein